MSMTSYSQSIVDFMSGGTAGCFAKTLTAPFERVKLLMQTQDTIPQIIKGEVPRYSGLVNTTTRVIAEQGVASLWRGNVANCMRFFPTQAFNFMFKDSIRRNLPKYDSKTQFVKSAGVNIAAGAAAGGGSLILVHPLDFARTRLAADLGRDGVNRQFSGLLDCLKQTTRHSGIEAVYAGFAPSFVMFTIYRGLYYGLYDSAKERSQVKHRGAKWLLAICTSAISGIVVYPMDTVRRRLMMQSGGTQLYSGFFHCCRTILANEGRGGFYKGLVPNMVRGVGGSVVLVVYDDLQEYMTNLRESVL